MKKTIVMGLAVLAATLGAEALVPKAAIVLEVHGVATVKNAEIPRTQLKLLSVLRKGDHLSLAAGAHVTLAFSVGGTRVGLDGPVEATLDTNGLEGGKAHLSRSGVSIPDFNQVQVDFNKMGGVSGRSLAHVITRQPQPQIDLSILHHQVNLGVAEVDGYLRTLPDGKWTRLPVKVVHQEDGRTTVQPARELAAGEYELNLESRPAAGTTADFNVRVLAGGAIPKLDEAVQQAHAAQATTADRLALIQWMLSYHLYDDACQELARLPRGPEFSQLEADIHQQRAAFESGLGLRP